MKDDNDTSVILADFGLSKFATPAEMMKNQCGTLSYLGEDGGRWGRGGRGGGEGEVKYRVH